MGAVDVNQNMFQKLGNIYLPRRRNPWTSFTPAIFRTPYILATLIPELNSPPLCPCGAFLSIMLSFASYRLQSV